MWKNLVMMGKFKTLFLVIIPIFAMYFQVSYQNELPLPPSLSPSFEHKLKSSPLEYNSLSLDLLHPDSKIGHKLSFMKHRIVSRLSTTIKNLKV